jgi:hypothetical protein
MIVLRKSQSRRMEGMTESSSGCARCDGVRVDQELKTVAKNVRWGRFRKDRRYHLVSSYNDRSPRTHSEW